MSELEPQTVEDGSREPCAEAAEAADTPSPSPCSEADARGCRWITSDDTTPRPGLWCCKPTAPGSAYCHRHRAIVWTASRRRSPALRKSPKPSKPLK
jgi:hypothetical protein